MTIEHVLRKLRQLGDPKVAHYKAKKFGIIAQNSLGIYQKDIKLLAAAIGKNHQLAQRCFDSGIYEAKILCSKIADPDKLTKSQMNKWVACFENWEICDSFCMALFAKSEFALAKAFMWTKSKHEFTKRAGFVIFACYGFNNKTASNAVFKKFFPVLIREARDERRYVYKAINWALRQIGKRNPDLHIEALKVARTILKIDYPSAQWIAKDAIAQLSKTKVNILDYPRNIYRT